MSFTTSSLLLLLNVLIRFNQIKEIKKNKKGTEFLMSRSTTYQVVSIYYQNTIILIIATWNQHSKEDRKTKIAYTDRRIYN